MRQSLDARAWLMPIGTMCRAARIRGVKRGVMLNNRVYLGALRALPTCVRYHSACVRVPLCPLCVRADCTSHVAHKGGDPALVRVMCLQPYPFLACVSRACMVSLCA
jgi:hypothetical protein